MPTRILHFIHDSLVAPAVPPVLGAVFSTADVHVHDLHATILHLLGFDHESLTYRSAGRDFRLTDIHGKVVHDIIA